MPLTTDSVAGAVPKAIEWVGGADGCLRLLDQTLLPTRVEYIDCDDVETVWEAIKVLRVRGAPAIGVAAAYGFCIGLRDQRQSDRSEFDAAAERVAAYLIGSRPTAVNLAWAVNRLQRAASEEPDRDSEAVWDALLAEARQIADEDAATCRRIGEHGATLIPDGGTVLTHCNAGALATSAYGTALSAMYVAHEQGKRFRVYADETRPLLQGARLTAFELQAAGIDVHVLCDNAAGALMAAGRVDLVIVGADRIAANGDTANKIGTYGLAVLAHHHDIPFYVAAPRSTFDLSLASGSGIPIEERGRDEVAAGCGRTTVPDGVSCFNPAFDVTPARLIRGIITEKGVSGAVSEAEIGEIFRNAP